MNRRTFILALCGLAVRPWRASAEANLRVIGIWWSPQQLHDFLAAYKQRLAELGWVEDHNIHIEVRAWDGEMANMRRQADELLGTHPEVIAAISNQAVAILSPMSGQVPIVFAGVADPVGSGFVESLAHPGGKITGFTNYEPSMGGKWLELLIEAAPATAHVLVLMHPETTVHKELWRDIERAARHLQIEAIAAGVRDSADIERAFAEFISARKGGSVISLPHAVTEFNRDLIVEQATAHLMPSIFAFAADAYAGALVTYGIDSAHLILQTADYVDYILRGTKPADLPVQAPQTFELVINLKTAKALGLTISPILLARADKVIE